MEKLIDKALKNGALAAKVCGAGGGGCIAFLCERERADEVENVLSDEAGVQMLKWQFAHQGLTVRELASDEVAAKDETARMENVGA